MEDKRKKKTKENKFSKARQKKVKLKLGRKKI